MKKIKTEGEVEQEAPGTDIPSDAKERAQRLADKWSDPSKSKRKRPKAETTLSVLSQDGDTELSDGADDSDDIEDTAGAELAEHDEQAIDDIGDEVDGEADDSDDSDEIGDDGSIEIDGDDEDDVNNTAEIDRDIDGTDDEDDVVEDSDDEYDVVERDSVPLPILDCMRCLHLMPNHPGGKSRKVKGKGGKMVTKAPTAKLYPCFESAACPARFMVLNYDPFNEDVLRKAATEFCRTADPEVLTTLYAKAADLGAVQQDRVHAAMMAMIAEVNSSALA